MGGGRSYEFNPEMSDPDSLSRSRLREHSEKLSKAKGRDLPPHGGEKISYGRRFAQTEDMYVARQMARELEELAREDGRLEPPRKKGRGRAPGPKAGRPARAEAKLPPPGSTAPIGALPPPREPPPEETLRELVTDATHYASMMRGAVRDLVTAGSRLARLPLDAALLLAARVRPLRA